MAIHDKQSMRSHHDFLRPTASMLATAVLACLVAATPSRQAAASGAGAGGFCTATARQQFAACLFETAGDLFKARAVCLNVSDHDKRKECYDEAVEERSETTALCGEQRRARERLCDALGEARYDPDFDPEDFDSDFRDLTRPNPYRPLRIGNRWTYAGGEEIVRIRVLDKTKLIDGVRCIVVNDRVWEEGELVEDTDDWFAQRKNGDVYYCGEESKDFEIFEGDDPAEPELVSIDGSFKWGRDGDKGGILFPGMPHVGRVHRQELSVGNAEDAAKVLSIHYRYGVHGKLDQHVPRAFVQRFCRAGDCVVTAEASPLEPGAFERKYYAPGIGLILEVNARSGEVLQLVDCNFDARCVDLPMP